MTKMTVRTKAILRFTLDWLRAALAARKNCLPDRRSP